MKKITVLSLALLSASFMFGWGQKGHDVTTAIASNHLTPATRHALDSLLEGKSIVYYANWLDNASNTPKYNYSKTWHYKNIDDGQTFESAPTLQSGDILTALEREVKILKNSRSTLEDNQLAVKMIIHLIGDMHQPMHMGHFSDRGGNKWKVKFFDTDSNLHTIWDSRVPEAGHKWSYSEWVEQLDRLDPEEIAEVSKGKFSDWAKESYEIATDIYRTTPQGSKVSYDYIATWTPVVESRFLKGGLRLADVLNSIFDPEYQEYNSSVK